MADENRIDTQVADPNINTDFIDELDKTVSDVADIEVPVVALNPSDVINSEHKITQMMPLRNNSWKQTFPILCCCASNKKVENVQNDQAFADEQERVMQRDTRLTNIIKFFKGKYLGSDYMEDALQSGQEVQTDLSEPLDSFGYGISAWLYLLRFMFCLFCVLSIFALGLAFLYHSKSNVGAGRSVFESYSLGGIGAANTMCISQFRSLNYERKLTCRKGTF